MSPEKQLIAIAEYCGWTSIGMLNGNPDQPAGFPPGANIRPESLPRYLNDLNAMHEALKTLSVGQHRYFILTLQVIAARDGRTDGNPHASASNATAPQRAESFLRTVGKWEES